MVAAIIKTSLKVCDCFACDIFDKDKNVIGQYEGYVPSFFPEVHYGDYVELKIDLATGLIVNWPTDIDTMEFASLITEANGYDEDEDSLSSKELKSFAESVSFIKMKAKVNDRFSCSIFDQEGNSMGDYRGYVPGFFPEKHFGDMVILTIDVKTGQIMNWKSPGEEIPEFEGLEV